ncbi:MAG TPA: DUF1272 domain-containing protein [bacterium]|nr:DUF1272 domain-containing protein [bacterium]
MLELRPNCENCNRPLPPHSKEAMICSFECTFCKSCVEGILENVCPNCGGGFSMRPIRPGTNWKNGDYLGRYPASGMIKHRPINLTAHLDFSKDIKNLPPEKR